MRRSLPIIAVVVAYLMVPGGVELAENVGHWLIHGDTAHADNQHADDGPRGEHGCSGAAHACSCHASPTFVTTVGPPDLAPPAADRIASVPRAVELRDSGFARRLLRPPRAV